MLVCVCREGFVGSKCQAEDPCSASKRPCGANGACFPIIQTQNIAGQIHEQISYHCQCYSGFYGQNCEFGIISNTVALYLTKFIEFKVLKFKF